MSTAERLKLWDEYSKKRTPELREKIIIEYAGLVKIVAGKLSIYLGNNVEYDDLVGYGTFGLIDAIDKFDADKGAKFETYASLRIRGAILDQIRKMDWVPRSLRQKQKQIDAAYQKLECMQGRSPSDEDIAAELNISVSELDEWQSQTKISSLVSLDECMEQGDVRIESPVSENYVQPEKVVERSELKKLIMKALEKLTEKEKKVVLLYYYEDLNLKEISRVMEVSESRISQLHSKAIMKLRNSLGNNMEMFLG